MTGRELEAANDFWSQLKELLRETSATEGLRFREASPNGVDVETRDGHALHVRFAPDNDRRQLTMNWRTAL